MIDRMGAGVLLGALACALLPQAAQAKHHAPRKPVAAVRVGLLTPKSPLIGPQLVWRGGYTPLQDMVRPRFVGGMVDVYPSSETGFRFSVGTRYFARTNFWIAAEQATRGILYDPHMTRGGRGLIRGYRRYTPAMTLGYDREMAPGLVLGVEGGALAGPAMLRVRPGRDRLSGGRDGDSGINPIATFSARLAF